LQPESGANDLKMRIAEKRSTQMHFARGSLVTDKDNKEYEFNVANNGGESSSIFDLGGHKDIWPEVGFKEKIMMKSKKLKTIIQKENLRLKDLNGLVLDTQGSELLVLKGAEELINEFRYINLEVADFKAYKNGCQLGEIENFLLENNFCELHRHRFATSSSGGNYYDIIYRRNFVI
jgi:FkbM family methyltransferase